MITLGETLLRYHHRLPWRVDFSVRSALGVLPDFAIVGFAKCATTSLYAYLNTHPDVYPADGKEQWYFSSADSKHTDAGNGPLNWYRFRFPYRLDKRIAAARSRPFLTGDGSPDYISFPGAIERMFAANPSARLFVSIRDPAARSYSYYRHELRAGRVARPFEELVRAEARAFELRGRLLSPRELYGADTRLKDTFLLGSVYAPRMRHLFEIYPATQIMVVQAEDLLRDPATQYRRALDFLGLPERVPPAWPRYNPGTPYNGSIPMEGFMRAFYAPFNRDLRDFLGLDLGW